jgi:putative transposase
MTAAVYMLHPICPGPTVPFVLLARRKSLPHEIPLWVDPQREIYFITINCEIRGTNQLATGRTAPALFATIRHRQEHDLWWPYVFLLMPDHVHTLISFPPSGKPIKLVVSKWKEWTAKTLGIGWQRDFFEHRLRHEESRREKADYILQNPVRKKLAAHPESWPFVYFAAGQRPQFSD